MPKRNNIVYTESNGKKGEYKIFSVKTKELLGTIKGNNIKMYWEAFDTDNKFLMSGSRKKECMDCFREMDTKRLMAKGGNVEEITKEEWKSILSKFLKQFYGDYEDSTVEDYENEDSVTSDQSKDYWANFTDKYKTEKEMSVALSDFLKSLTEREKGLILIKKGAEQYADAEEHDKNKIYSTITIIKKSKAENYAKGGGIDFDKLSRKVAKNYEGDKVAPKYQHEYGKTYSKAEAKEVGDKVAGKVYWQQQGRKMEDGGNTDKMNEYIRKKREDQEKEEEGKDFAPFRAFVYSGSDQFADFKTDDFHKAVKWAKETLEQQRIYRKSSENLWAIVDEFTPIEKRNNVIYAYSEVARFGEEDMKDMKFENGGSMSSSSSGFYIVLADGSKKEYSVNSITEIPNIYFAMGFSGVDKGTPMVHHDNVLTSVFYANGTPVEAMPQYAGKDYYDLKKKMADGGNVAEDEDYYRVFRNNAGKDIAVKIVKNPIFGKFDYYVDGTLRGQFDSFAQARQEVNYENFDMYKDGGNLHSSEFYAEGGGVGNINKWEKGDITIVNGEYLKRAEVVPSYKDDTMRGNYFVVFRDKNKKIIESKDNFEAYSDALRYAKENVNKEDKSNKKMARGGGIDKTSKTNIPSTDELVKLVANEREKKIKEWRRMGEKVVVGRNDGYWWTDGSDKEDEREISTNPSNRKIKQIIKEYPDVTEIHFYGTIKSSERVGFEMEIIDDFDVLLWSKEDNFFKKGLTFEFTRDNGKYKNTLIEKSETIEYKDREDSGEFLYYKSIDKYGNVGQGRIYRDVLQEDFDNGDAVVVGKMAKGGLVVTSIKDIPNFKEENEAGRITYRGLGMGKLSNDFYKVAGEGGTRIKVNGKEYYITMTEFNTFSRDSSGKMRIKFDAPFRKFAEGGKTESKNYYIVTFGFNGDEGYQVVKSKPILASNENEAQIMLKDQFESYEGVSCEIFSVEKQSGKMATGGNLHSSEFYKDGGEIVDTPKKSNIFIARYNGKKIELEAKSMFDAEKKAIEQLKVPKFKRGLLSVMNKQAYEKGDFQFN